MCHGDRNKKYHVIPSLKEHVCNAVEEERGPYLKPLFLSARKGVVSRAGRFVSGAETRGGPGGWENCRENTSRPAGERGRHERWGQPHSAEASPGVTSESAAFPSWSAVFPHPS